MADPADPALHLVCGIGDMGDAGGGGEEDACDRWQGVLAAAAAVGGGCMDDVAWHCLGNEASGEGGR